MLQQVNSRLSTIHILLIDPDRELSILIRRVLRSLGFNSIYVVQDGHSALHILKSRPVDLVITDWEMAPMSGIEFIQHVRTHPDSPNPFVPIIMLTAYAKRWHVETARDTGITEFLVKPFTAKALCDRITLVIDSPRNFIISQSYKGPDRRRKTNEDGSVSNRRSKESQVNMLRLKKEQFIEQKGGKPLAGIEQDNHIFLIDSDFSLKKRIGMQVSLQDIFNSENLKEAQRIIFESRDSFLEWAVGDLSAFEEAYKGLESHHPLAIQQMRETAIRVKGRAGTFGYDLASQIAESLHDMLLNLHQADRRILNIVRTHLDVLYIIFQQNIQGHGGNVGVELIQNLEFLSKKYKSSGQVFL